MPLQNMHSKNKNTQEWAQESYVTKYTNKYQQYYCRNVILCCMQIDKIYMLWEIHIYKASFLHKTMSCSRIY